MVRHEAARLVRSGPARLVDVGLGAQPWTTLEAAHALRALRPDLEVVGIDVDPERVETARSHAEPGVRFEVGGMGHGGPARVVRAMNLLRQYRPEQVPAAHAALGEALEDGGLLLEGSTDKEGHVLCAHLLGKEPGGGLVSEGLLLWTDFARGFAPILFRDWLPRDLRKRVVPGTGVHATFQEWMEIWSGVRTGDPRQSFVRSAPLLEGARVDLDLAGGAAVVLAPGSYSGASQAGSSSVPR